MQEHWEKIGYKPETDSLNEVDEVIELEVQVGRKDKEKETNLIPESTFTSKYTSVIVKGFRNDTSIESILEILSQHGLPGGFKKESLVQNGQTGSITLENLKPEECLDLITGMHKKRFLNRQIFVTSVVADSPVKPTVQPEKSSALEGSLKPNSTLPQSPQPIPADSILPNLGKPLLLKLPATTHNSDSASPTSPGVKDKINQIENQTSSTLLSISGRTDKRKSEASPEADDLSKKEKKKIREEERKQDKTRKKLEYKEKNNIKCQINNSY